MVREQLSQSLKDAIRSQNKITSSTIRLILASLKQKDIDARGKGNDNGIADADIFLMLQSMIKQRVDSIKIYKDAGRDDLADQETQEIAVIERFLPKQLSEQEISEAIKALVQKENLKGLREMGKLMAALKEKYAGQIDMTVASKIAKIYLC